MSGTAATSETTATIYINFQPSSSSPIEFQTTLDGDQYTCLVTWNLATQTARDGAGWYLSVYDLNGTLIINTAMVGSPPGYNINLVAPLFTTQIVYRVQNLQFEIIG